MNIWKEIFYGIFRNLLAAAAGFVFKWMTAKGLITEGQAAAATISLVAFGWALVWSTWQKIKAKYKFDLGRILQPEDATNATISDVTKNAGVSEIVSSALSKTA